jgi:hypothetical protein
MTDAFLMYSELLKKDPKFAPAERNLEYIMTTRFGFGNPPPR